MRDALTVRGFPTFDRELPLPGRVHEGEPPALFRSSGCRRGCRQLMVPFPGSLDGGTG